MTASSPKPTRQLRNVVRNPPKSGPTVAATEPIATPDTECERAIIALVRGGDERRRRRRHRAPPRPPSSRDQPKSSIVDVEAQRSNRRAYAVDERAVEEGPLPAQDVLKLRAEQHETRHSERVRRDDALDDVHGRAQLAHQGRDSDVEEKRVDNDDKARERCDGERSPAGVRSTVIMPASRSTTH